MVTNHQIDKIDMRAAATLVVAWQSGRNAQARTVRAGGQVIEVLRGYAVESLERFAAGTWQPYNPDDEQEDGAYLFAERDELLDTAMLEQIERGAALPLATSAEAQSQRLVLYALLIGDDPESRTAFIRKTNPVMLATKGLVAIFNDTLDRVEQPILAFDSSFDVVLTDDEVLIISQRNFEALFKESDAVLAKTEKWAEELGRHVPISADAQSWLAGRLRQNSVVRRKVESVLRSRYLDKLTIEELRRRMPEHGLDPAELIVGDRLVVNKDTEKSVLLLLNEDLWTGDFSGSRYAAARKAVR
jgi:hypothetical protein